MNSPRTVSAAIFDMDGLILNTEHAYSEGTQAVLSRYGQVYTIEMKTQLMGKRAIDSATRLLEMVDLPMSPEEFLTVRDEELRQLFPRCIPLPGVAQLIQSLSAAEVPIAVGTSSGHDLFKIKTAPHRELFDLFNTTVTVDDPAVKNGKPAPDIFLVAAERLSVAPEDCIVFEDSATGVAAARAAGMSVVAVPDEQMDKALYQDADEVVDSLTDFDPARYGLEV